MSLSRPANQAPTYQASASNGISNGSATRVLPRQPLQKMYGYLTIAQAGSGVVFTTFLATHLSATALASLGGIELVNKAMLLGRVYYQHGLLEPIVVVGAAGLHVLSGLAKRVIKLYWKQKGRDERRLTGDTHERIERKVTETKNEEGIPVRKVTTKTITSISTSYATKAAAWLGGYHALAGYLLIPLGVAHAVVYRVLPKRHFGDSSLINATYVTLTLQRWPKSSYLFFGSLIGLGVYHMASGLPTAYRILYGACGRKNGDRTLSLTKEDKKRHDKFRRAAIGVTWSVLLAALFFMGRRNIRVPLRREYLRVYGRVLPESWVRY